MPSLKRSSTRRRRYGGGTEKGQQEFREALEVYLYLQGREYKRTHPYEKFVTPTVDEVLGYMDSLHKQIKEQTAQKLVKGGRHRARRTSHHRMVGGVTYLEVLLNTLFGPATTLCEKVFRVLAMTLCAIGVSVFLAKFAVNFSGGMTVKESFSSTVADPEYMNSFADPLRYATHRLHPEHLEFYDALFLNVRTLIAQGFSTVSADELPEIPQSMVLSSIGWLVAFIMEKLVNSTLYSKAIVMPISLVLYNGGMTSCQAVYERASTAGMEDAATAMAGVGEAFSNYVRRMTHHNHTD